MEDQDHSLTGPSFSIKTSANDKRANVYSQRILCLSLDDANDNIERATSILRDALQRCIDDLPILAGRLLRRESPMIQPGGHAHLKVKDLRKQISFSHLKSKGFPQSSFGAELTPIPVMLLPPVDEAPVCLFQANFVEGGVLLTTCVSHIAMDGAGITILIQRFAAHCKQVQDPAVALPPLDPRAMSRDLLDFGQRTFPLEQLSETHPQFTYLPDGLPKQLPPESLSRFKNHGELRYISGKAVRQLKEDLSSRVPEAGISTHDAMLGLLWHAHVKAMHDLNRVHGHEVSEIIVPMDVRKLLKLPATYAGNAIHSAFASLPTQKIMSADGPSLGAVAIRTAIKAVTADQVKDYLRILEGSGKAVEEHKIVPKHTAFTGGGISFMMTSYYGFDMYGLNFGAAFGTVERFRLPDTPRGIIPIFLPRIPDQLGGGCEMSLIYDDPVFESLDKNDIWTKYVAKA